MQLYYSVPSTYCQKVLLALYEKSIEFEKVPVNLMQPEQRQKYCEEVHALGKIPVLKTEAGDILPESSIIIEYLDQRSPESNQLIPSDPTTALQVRLKDRMCDLYLVDAVSNLFFQSMKPDDGKDMALIRKCEKHLDYMYQKLEASLQCNGFIAGEQFSMADCAAIPALFYAQEQYPFSGYPNICDYFQRMQARASYRRVSEELMPALVEMFGRQ